MSADLTPAEIATCLHKLQWGSQQTSFSTELKPKECAWLLNMTTVASKRSGKRKSNGK